MAMETAIQGFGLLQKALEGRAERKQTKELKLTELAQQKEEAEADRLAALERTKISAASGMMQESRLARAEKRALDLGGEVAKTLDTPEFAGDPEVAAMKARLQAGDLNTDVRITDDILTRLAASGDPIKVKLANDYLATKMEFLRIQAYDDNVIKMQSKVDAEKALIGTEYDWQKFADAAERVLASEAPGYNFTGDMPETLDQLKGKGWGFAKKPKAFAVYATQNKYTEDQLSKIRVKIADALAQQDPTLFGEVTPDGTVIANADAMRNANIIYTAISTKGIQGLRQLDATTGKFTWRQDRIQLTPSTLWKDYNKSKRSENQPKRSADEVINQSLPKPVDKQRY